MVEAEVVEDEASEPEESEDQEAEQDDESSSDSDSDSEDFGEAGDMSALREMVEYVARALTTNPDAVSVSEETDSNRTVFHLSVDEKDKGKVIGRDGRVAQSIRSLLRVAATKQGTRITLEID